MTNFIDSWAAFFILKATLAAGLGLLAAWLARSSRASVRHALLAATFAVLLALPAVSSFAPPLRITVRPPAPRPSLAAFDDAAPLVIPTTAGRAIPPAEPAARTFSFPALLIPAWALGVAIFLAPMLVSLWRVRSLRRSALPWMSAKPAIPAKVDLLLHESVSGPMTCGVVHPAVVLPADAPRWQAGDLDRALIHELEHVRRGDWITHCLARFACALYWFHPLVWMAWRRLALEAERCCDDAVIRDSEATAYAEQLVSLARRQLSPHLAMANRTDLTARVRALLDARQRRGRAGARAIGLTCAAAAAVALAMSPLRIVTAAQDTPGTAFDAVSVKLVDAATGMYHSHEDEDPVHLSMSGNVHRFLIRAYGIADAQIGNEPEWFKTHLYGIDAVSAKPSDEAQQMLMLRAALADRFQIKLREEDRDMPVYNLEVAPGGPKFKELVPGEKLSDGHDAADVFSQTFTSLDQLTRSLNRVYGGRLSVDRPVVDRTNLTGQYKMHLETEIEREVDASGVRVLHFPSLPHDLQAQLGLRLVPGKLKMPYYTVEHAALPKPN